MWLGRRWIGRSWGKHRTRSTSTWPNCKTNPSSPRWISWRNDPLRQSTSKYLEQYQWAGKDVWMRQRHGSLHSTVDASICHEWIVAFFAGKLRSNPQAVQPIHHTKRKKPASSANYFEKALVKTAAASWSPKTLASLGQFLSSAHSDQHWASLQH